MTELTELFKELGPKRAVELVSKAFPELGVTLDELPPDFDDSPGTGETTVGRLVWDHRVIADPEPNGCEDKTKCKAYGEIVRISLWDKKNLSDDTGDFFIAIALHITDELYGMLEAALSEWFNNLPIGLRDRLVIAVDCL